jgi:hypothetical protein
MGGTRECQPYCAVKLSLRLFRLQDLNPGVVARPLCHLETVVHACQAGGRAPPARHVQVDLTIVFVLAAGNEVLR